MTTAALDFARSAHENQFRKFSGAPYIVHPVAVASMLISWGVTDEILLSAAYLHDVLEDTPITEETLAHTFGDAVTQLVREVTKGRDTDKQVFIDTIAATGSLHACVLKLADRICNTRDFAESGKIRKAREYFASATCIYDRVRNDHLKSGSPILAAAIAAWDHLAQELQSADPARE